ncbi:SDR family oxidoreductase [Rickettsiales bacterium LUAb2]
MKKVILFGATGFVGKEVLQQLVTNNEISKIICITRKRIDFEHHKITNHIQEDFLFYSNNLAKKLAEYDGCIWTLGGKISDNKESLQEYKQITYDFTLNFAKSIVDLLNKPFIFCYLSGMGAKQSGKVWFTWEKITRILKGKTEKDLSIIANNSKYLKVYCFRPAGILPARTNRIVKFLLSPISITVDKLANAFINTIVNNQNMPKIISNRNIKKLY